MPPWTFLKTILLFWICLKWLKCTECIVSNSNSQFWLVAQCCHNWLFSWTLFFPSSFPFDEVFSCGLHQTPSVLLRCLVQGRENHLPHPKVANENTIISLVSTKMKNFRTFYLLTLCYDQYVTSSDPNINKVTPFLHFGSYSCLKITLYYVEIVFNG